MNIDLDQSQDQQPVDEFPDGLDASFFTPADDEHVRREKAKARDLRSSQWWKNELAKGLCYYCQRRFHPRDLTMDHIVPIIRGGMTRKGNVVPACKTCNNQKKYLVPAEWQEYLERLKQ